MEKTRKKMGRPPAKPGELRDRSLEIRLNAGEESLLRSAGGEAVSTWAREVLLRAAKRASAK